MKSVKSAHSCTIKIPRTIPATTPTEKIKSMFLGNYLCASRVGDREGIGEALTDRMVTRKGRMTVIILRQEF